MRIDIADALDDCLDRLTKGEDIETCLSLYPEQAAELEPLLHTAKAIRTVSQLAPDPARKEAEKRRFLALAASQPPSSSDGPKLVLFPRHPSQEGFVLLGRTAAAALLLVATVGPIVASADSTPDAPLYAVKRATEQAQLFLARGEDGKTALHAELADRRLGEIDSLASRRGEIPLSLLSDLAAETDRAIDGLDKTDDKARLAAQLLSLSSRQQEVLNRVAAKAPAEAREGLERALERSRRGLEAASKAVEEGKKGDEKDKKPATALPTATAEIAVPAGRTPTPAGDRNDGPPSTPARDEKDLKEASTPKPASTFTPGRPTPKAEGGNKKEDERRTPDSHAATPGSADRDGDDNRRRR